MGIQSKDNHLPIKSRHSNLNTDTMVVTKTREEFIVWIRLAINDRECGAYEELYQFLTSCFVRSDSDKDGRVTFAHFDDMIEGLLSCQGCMAMHQSPRTCFQT